MTLNVYIVIVMMHGRAWFVSIPHRYLRCSILMPKTMVWLGRLEYCTVLIVTFSCLTTCQTFCDLGHPSWTKGMTMNNTMVYCWRMKNMAPLVHLAIPLCGVSFLVLLVQKGFGWEHDFKWIGKCNSKCLNRL